VSFDALLWATNDAPIADVNEFAVLMMLAEKADADGCNAFPSRPTMASRTHIDPKTVLRTLQRLEGRGLIAKGDQSAAAYLRADRRPVVYDLMIPYSWFSNIDRINRERADRGRSPLTREGRPDLAAPPEKRRRSDLGRKRAPRAGERGDYESPRAEEGVFADGGTLSPERGDSQSGTGGLVVTQPSPLTLSEEPSSSPSVPHGGPEPLEQQGGGGGDAPQEEPNGAAAVFVDSLPYRGRLPGPKQRAHLIAAVAGALEAGWPADALRRQLTADTETAKSMAAVYRHRLEPENLPAPPSAAVVVPGPRTVVHDSRNILQECDGQDGMCGRPTGGSASGLCRSCERERAAAADSGLAAVGGGT
jgi:hypothetical protein